VLSLFVFLAGLLRPDGCCMAMCKSPLVLLLTRTFSTKLLPRQQRHILLPTALRSAFATVWSSPVVGFARVIEPVRPFPFCDLRQSGFHLSNARPPIAAIISAGISLLSSFRLCSISSRYGNQLIALAERGGVWGRRFANRLR